MEFPRKSGNYLSFNLGYLCACLNFGTCNAWWIYFQYLESSGRYKCFSIFLPQMFFLFRIQKKCKVLMVLPLQVLQNLSSFTKVTSNLSLSIGQFLPFFRFHSHAPAVTALPSSSKLTVTLNDDHIKNLHNSDHNVM